MEIKPKNSDRTILIDDSIYRKLKSDFYLLQIGFFENLRVHKTGCVVFHKTYSKKKKSVEKTFTTIYLHKIIAEKFLANQKTEKQNLVITKNGNKLDCRIANLAWCSRSFISYYYNKRNGIDLMRSFYNSYVNNGLNLKI